MLVSSCDAIVGVSGRVAGIKVVQAQGVPYTRQDWLSEPELVHTYAMDTTSYPVSFEIIQIIFA